MSEFKHFSASIHLPGHRFPLCGIINEERLLMLANNGTTPHGKRIEELRPEVERIGNALREGRVVTTKTATISPISEEEYERAG